MSASWVAGTVRSKAIARRRVGAAAARAIALNGDLADAVATLSGTAYRHDVRMGQGLAEAQHAVAATLLWHLRVLAGWLPREGAQAIRLLAGGFEVANVDEQVRRLHGLPAEPSYRLGNLETAWTRLAATSSLEDLRRVLASSPWGDPGSATARDIHLGVRLCWAERVAGGVPAAAGWARSALVLLLVRENLLAGRPLAGRSAERAAGVLGPAFVDALARPGPSLAEVTARLPDDCREPFRRVREDRDLWRAEAAWWHLVEDGGFAMLRAASFGPAAPVGTVGVLAADAWRVRAALEAACRSAVRTGGIPPDRVREAFDALA